MANIKSAIKRIRTTKKETNINKALKTQVKTAIKKCRNVLKVESSDSASVNDTIILTQKLIDKACKKGVLHKNTASRKKSSLMKQQKV